MINKLSRFLKHPPSRRVQLFSFVWNGLVTRWWYGWSLKSVGKRSIIFKPLFWTPEFIEVGDDVLIWPGCRIEGIQLEMPNISQKPLIHFGDGVIMQQGCHITACGELRIENGTLMSFNVAIQDSDHCYEDTSMSVTMQPIKHLPTYIGENCFIGARASILAGTTLGRHCIIGANSVVRGIYPDYCVLVGAPARVVKRYDPVCSIWRLTDPTGNFK